MLDLGACLRYYKRADVQKAIVESAKDREVSVRYLEGGFGKRPDVLVNNSDVIENAKQKASSFHCSEEIWVNPLQINTNMRKDEITKLRKGWDLVLDIDCPYWELAKITTWLFIEALRQHGIKSISLKFSGNKGFHIGIPFKAFPEIVPGKEILTKDYFPDGPRRIAQYLVNYIEKNLIKIENNELTFGNKIKYSLEQLKQMTGKKLEELTYKELNGKKIREKKSIAINPKYHYQCSSCGNSEVSETEYKIATCNKCGKIMDQLSVEKKKELNTIKKFDVQSIINVDTILIASRHLYRMVYSLHEKTGMASIPIDINRILLFEKDEAKADDLQLSNISFLDDSRTTKGEAEGLLKAAFDFNPLIETEEDEKRIKKAFNLGNTEQIMQKVPEELFPPCIKLMLQGMKDGKKRSLFILINYLTSLGWNYDEIKERLHEWNKLNPEQLRETLIVTHLNYHKQQKKNVLPPNCPGHASTSYYKDLGLCHPDGLCQRIKNPVQYAKKRAWILNQEQSKKKKEKKSIKKDEPNKKVPKEVQR